MPTRRYYANAAPQRTLSGSLNSSATSLAVSGTFAGWPTQFPFYATLDIGTASAEIVLVTAIASSTATIVRGQDGTAAIAHAAGATFDQTVVRQDLDEASAHTSSNAGVHGVSGSVVGTSDAQTLTNKTLSSPTVTGTSTGTNATLSGTLTVAGAATLNGAVSATAAGTGLAVTNNATVGGNLTVTGASSGVIVPKSFTNEAAATAAIGSPVAGSVVYLTAPTTGGVAAGLYQFINGAWIPVGSKAYAQVRLAAAASIPNAAFTAIAWDTTDFAFGTTTGAGGVTITTPGVYEVCGGAQFLANATGRREAQITKNGVRVEGSHFQITPTATNTTGIPISAVLVSCAASDIITIQAFQNSGGGLNMSPAGSDQCVLTVKRYN